MKTRGKKKRFISSFVALGLLCSLILIINSRSLTVGASDPNFYYYYSGRKIPLTLSKENITVRFKQGVTLEQEEAVVGSEPNLGLFFEREELPVFKLTLLPLREAITEEDIIKTINSLNSKSEVEFACPVFHSLMPN